MYDPGHYFREEYIKDYLEQDEVKTEELKQFDRTTRRGSICLFLVIVSLLVAGGVTLRLMPYDEWANSYIPWLIGIPLFLCMLIQTNYSPYRQAKRRELLPD